MTKIVENYLILELIGKGQYGEVYKAKHMISSEIFAIKILKFD